ncbi:MAG: trypsin-like peptidase domain-containing protein [Deltaproteobacteria bacterium]|nr:trypsin-like peptidase domain-containing protein [Deltaproteobacteria bacterium]MBW2118073.1 trypsin-like peptidase domain-containing protein [Deltaproteobacteria bacterium]
MKSGTHVLLSIMVMVFFLSSAWGYEGVNKSEDIASIRKGIVRISVTAQVPDYSVPWNPGRITRGVGTGFLISGKRIVTNAHISSNARFIAVQKENDSRMYEAKVRFIAHDCDLALLEVPDKSFFDGMVPLSLGGMPSLDSTVTVLGYPIGGRRLSVTRGIVSRIDFRTYSHSAADSHLTIQIDAAINPGNSGGPVLQDNSVVGVAFQGFSGNVAQNVGYMIPVPVIKRFLTDIKDGQYDRYVDLSVSQFPLLNNAYRRAMGLAPGDYGVIVSSVLKTSPASRILRPGDVLLAIDGLPIFSNGYVKMGDERVRMEEVVERKYKGDSVRLKIIRDRNEIDVTIPLISPWPYLIHARRHDVKPRFVVFGGLIFQPLSYNFLRSSNIKDINIRYHSYNFINNELYLKTPEIVVLSKILPDPINVYLRGFVNSIVQKINDKNIRTLEDVSEAFKEPADYYVIRLLGKHRPVVLERKAVKEARERIIRGYGVLKEEYLGDSIVPADWLDVSLNRN